MTVRPLTSVSEFQECLQLQRDGFGWADIDLMPVRLFVVTHHTGGLVLGAFDGDRLIGFLSTLPGIRNAMPYWHSHMMTVTRDYQNSGIGLRLKLEQREHAIRRGIRLIEWTFDPLESKNAYFNLEKVGVIVRRYYFNLYGETTGTLQRGLPSDRVIAEWWLDRPRIALEGEVRRVRIPVDIQALKNSNMEAARQIQGRVREEFLQHTSEDFCAVTLERKPEWSEYVFVRGASRAYPAD